MSTNNTIAIIGASANRTKYGNKAVRAYQAQGYAVYPVNPGADEIEGLKAYASVGEIPGEVETASVYLPPHKTLTVLDDLKAKGVSTIFLNPGSEDETVVARADELGLNIVQACSIVSAGRSPGEFV
ncbi:MAG: CoA-binding protein [Candidatus Hinthialibacter antarcticus]|nr:CoA-binding protein [Candidatus Hinthialibacter antarcticus]